MYPRFFIGWRGVEMSLCAYVNYNILTPWLADLQQDPVVWSVLESEPFARLARVSFLGALDHLNPAFKPWRGLRSRADHSLQVAALANFVAAKRGYSGDLKRHLVVAGLLHDIGHLPLSHSAESCFRVQTGIGHHEQGERIVTGECPFGQALNRHLAAHLDVDFLVRLIAGKVGAESGGDLFSSAINIDTIDGIIRAHRCLTAEKPALDVLRVAQAAFIDEGRHRYDLLDKFWELKDRVYANFINQPPGLLADGFCRSYFAADAAKIEEDDFCADESLWLGKHHRLFTEIRHIGAGDYVPRELAGATISYLNRRYLVDNAAPGFARYRQFRKKKQYNLKDLHD